LFLLLKFIKNIEEVFNKIEIIFFSNICMIVLSLYSTRKKIINKKLFKQLKFRYIIIKNIKLIILVNYLIRIRKHLINNYKI